jgi:SAM-dependent MidA family methyltransferase
VSTPATPVDLVRAAIRAKGRITFAEFMQTALYASGVGYYTSGRLRSGPPHDFYTSPHVHPVFGRYLARHLAALWEALGGPDHYDVVEMGSGRGLLCADILAALKDQVPACWQRLHYTIVEIGGSPDTAIQSALSAAAAHPVRLMPELEGLVTGCILSNELVDAFPVHRLQVHDGALQEIYVTLADDKLTDDVGPPSTEELVDYVIALGMPPEDWQGEVSLETVRWIRQVAKALQRGFVLTIDYGATWEELCSPRYSSGTLVCYHRHQANRQFYERIGQQDITAHVNFTALIRYGEASGLQTLSYGSQMEYLASLGMGERLAELARRPQTAEVQREKRAIADLLWPDGLGGFRILLQQKS